MKQLKTIVKDQLTSLELIDSYLTVYKKTLSEKERNFYLEIKAEKENENLSSFISGLIGLYEEKSYQAFFTLINDNIDFFLNPISEENLELLKKHHYFLDFEDKQYLIRNRNYILNYAEILKESSFMVDVKSYLDNTTSSEEIYKIILEKFNYIKEEIGD